MIPRHLSHMRQHRSKVLISGCDRHIFFRPTSHKLLTHVGNGCITRESAMPHPKTRPQRSHFLGRPSSEHMPTRWHKKTTKFWRMTTLDEGSIFTGFTVTLWAWLQRAKKNFVTPLRMLTVWQWRWLTRDLFVLAKLLTSQMSSCCQMVWKQRMVISSLTLHLLTVFFCYC